MKVRKQDLMITYYEEKCYRLSIRKTVLFFFTRWEPLTYQETENTKELPVEFETFEEATEFIDTIT